MMAVFAALAFAAALYVPRRVRLGEIGGRMEALEAFLTRWGALVVGVASPFIVWYVWGQVHPVPVIHDESSYLLQAEIFARGRWTVPTPPLPEFFEQPHVQVVPALASKYPPGHALLLSFGARVGWPVLVPLLLTGVTAAMLFALATRLHGPWVALFSCAFWVSAPIVLRFQPSYLSEITTTPALLGSWWSLLEWRETRRRRWLLLLAFLIGWGAITRPYTMLILAIPIGIVVVRDAARLRHWRDLGFSVAIGAAVLALLPVWSARTTGDWKLWPVEKYRRDYAPFDKLGFTPDTTPPARQAQMSRVLNETYDYFMQAKREQRLATLPRTVVQRAANIGIGFFGGSRLPLAAFAIVGLFALTGPMRFGVWSALLLFVAYLPYPYRPGWTVYHLETAPVVALLTAIGVARVARRLAGNEVQARLGLALASGVMAIVAVPHLRHWRGVQLDASAFDREFARVLTTLPSPGILFVRYSPRVEQNVAVVRNHADLAGTPIWVVHDLGPRNAELLRVAPDRKAHHFDADRVVRAPTVP